MKCQAGKERGKQHAKLEMAELATENDTVQPQQSSEHSASKVWCCKQESCETAVSFIYKAQVRHYWQHPWFTERLIIYILQSPLIQTQPPFAYSLKTVIDELYCTCIILDIVHCLRQAHFSSWITTRTACTNKTWSTYIHVKQYTSIIQHNINIITHIIVTWSI